MVVVLEKDGRASINGDAATWNAREEQIQVRASDGTVYVGRVAADALHFQVDTVVVTFTRVAVARPTTRSPSELKATALEGKRLTPPGTELSFVVAKGWTSGWETRDGTDVFVIARGTDATILASGRQLDAHEKTLGPAALLERWSPASAEVRTVEAAREFTVKGQLGAIVVRESAKPAMRLVLAVVIVDGWGIVLVGVSPPAKATLVRGALETILVTLEGRVPAAASTNVVGCWSSYESHGKSGSSSRKVILAQDGSYRWTSRNNFSGVGGSVSEEAGTWTQRGSELVLTPQSGQRTTYNVRFEEGALYLGGLRFSSCSG
ncbi:MAG: hypothetical protein ACKV2T_15740 [Kofleriaceae bacterium]